MPENNFSSEFDQIFDTFDQLLTLPSSNLEVSENTLDSLLSNLLEKDSSYLRNYYTKALQRAKDEAAEAARPLSLFEREVNTAVDNLFHSDREGIVRSILKNQEMHDTASRIAHTNNSSPSVLTTMGVEGIANVVDSMIGPDLVGVQPMQGPVGLIYSLQYRYRPAEKVENNKEALEEALKALQFSVEGNPGRKLALDVVSAAIEAVSRKCSPHWTIEAMQDLNHFGLDIEAEMRGAMAHELALEFDNEMLADLRKLGAMGDSVPSIDIEETDVHPGNLEHLRGKLGCGIRRACSLIARQTRRGAGNWIVVSPIVLSLLQITKDFVMTQTSPRMPAGRMKVGIFQSSINVYVDSYADDNNILVGYKGGNGETDTGYYWAPYVLLMMGGVVVNALTFGLQTSFLTRYGKYIVDGDDEYTVGSGESYYQTVEVNLPANFLGEDDGEPVEAGTLGANVAGEDDTNISSESRVETFGGYANTSDRRGSKVETLGELPGLEYFANQTALEAQMLGNEEEK